MLYNIITIYIIYNNVALGTNLKIINRTDCHELISNYIV